MKKRYFHPLHTFVLGVFTFCIFCTPLALAKRATTQETPATFNIPITGFSNDPAIPIFDAHFIPFLKKWRVPGASLVVIKNNQVVVNRGYGWKDKASGTPITPESLFRIASVSKTFTAVTILKLIEEGKLHLDDSVFTLLNDIKPLPGKTINPRIYQITVRNLLQMSSGWFSNGGHFDPMFGPWPPRIANILRPELPASCETTTRFMMSQSLRSKPGTTYTYSNLDYCMLGLIINKVTGSRYGYSGYENYVKKNILAPIGIHDMYIGSTLLKYRTPNEATYYRDPRSISPEELANSSYLPYSTDEILKKNFANGGWVATPKDLAMFIQALHQGRILNEASLRFMQTKPAFVSKDRTTYYTIGGKISYLNQQRYWIQTGSFTGTNALIITKPNGTTIAILFNYRPDTYSFLHRFRPELEGLIIRSGL
jgi:CubicO group peptidase (beta-lactamase class C family)